MQDTVVEGAQDMASSPGGESETSKRSRGERGERRRGDESTLRIQVCKYVCCCCVWCGRPGRPRNSSIGCHRDMVTALSLIGNKHVVPILLSASRDGCIKAWR